MILKELSPRVIEHTTADFSGTPDYCNESMISLRENLAKTLISKVGTCVA